MKNYEGLLNDNFLKTEKNYEASVVKLIEKSLDVNNEIVKLATLLNKISNRQNELEEKEDALGLKEAYKPYGEWKVELIKNDALVYEGNYLKLNEAIDEFSRILDRYAEADATEKKEMFEKLEVLIFMLKDHGIEPLSFIITPERTEVWKEIENNFSLSVRTVDVEFFIENIKMIKLKHSETINKLNEYNEKVDEYFKLSKTNENVKYPERDFNLEPLLIDTQSLIASLSFNVVEVPEHLNEEDKNELKDFLPVLHEYYKDQICALSGGVSYTSLSNDLKSIQTLIDEGRAVGDILKELPVLQNSMQHLYILHWIGESLLKEILNCFRFSCSMGRTIKMYKDKFQTKTSYKKISDAVHFRNNVAHKGYIWKPVEFENSINIYREYIETVSDEQNVDLSEFYLGVVDNKIDHQAKKDRAMRFLNRQKGNLKLKRELITDDMLEYAVKFLERYGWSPNEKKIEKLIYELKHRIYDKFCKENFNGLSYEEVKSYLISYAQKYEASKLKEDENLEKHALSQFVWTALNNTEKKKKDVQKAVKKLKSKIEKVSDVKFSKGLFGWLK